MMMLRCLVSMLLPALAGCVLVCREEALSRIEKAVFAFSLGSCLLSFYLYGLMLLRLPLTGMALVVFFLPFFVRGLQLRRDIADAFLASRGPSCSSPVPFGKLLTASLIGIVVGKLVFIIFIASAGPTIFSDAYTLWNYKAKIIFYQHLSNAGPVTDSVFEGSASVYPLLIPIMRAWTAWCLGTWDDAGANLYSIVLFLCLLTLVYALLHKRTGSRIALLCTAVLACLPILLYNVMSGYADFAVGYFFLAATIALSYWRRTGSRRLLLFAGLLAAGAMFTKNEGTAIVFPALLAAILGSMWSGDVSGKQARAGAGLFVLAALPISAWFFQSHALAAILTTAGIRNFAIRFHPEGLGPLLQQLFVFRSHNLFWYGIVLLFIVKGKAARHGEPLFFLVPSLLALLAILFVFLGTPNVAWLLDGTTINRTLLIVMPLLTVTAGLLFAPGPDERAR